MAASKIENMTDEQKLRALQDLSKSKGWLILKSALINKRSGSVLGVVQRLGQSQPEYSLDDIYKKSISIYNSIISYVDDEVKSLEARVILDGSSDEEVEVDIGNTDDLFDAR